MSHKFVSCYLQKTKTPKPEKLQPFLDNFFFVVDEELYLRLLILS